MRCFGTTTTVFACKSRVWLVQKCVSGKQRTTAEHKTVRPFTEGSTSHCLSFRRTPPLIGPNYDDHHTIYAIFDLLRCSTVLQTDTDLCEFTRQYRGMS